MPIVSWVSPPSKIAHRNKTCLAFVEYDHFIKLGNIDLHYNT